MKEQKCCLCGNKLDGEFGNNPFPLKEKGSCCNNCNTTKVIPARIKNANEKRSTN